MARTPYQDLVVDSLANILKFKPLLGGNLNKRFKETLVAPAVRHYPEITRAGDITYKNIGFYTSLFKWSERAEYEYNKSLQLGSNPYDVIKMEHIYPVDMIIQDLFKLPIGFSKADISNIFDYKETVINNGITIDLSYEILIVSDEEAKVLNGRKSSLYDLTDIITGTKVKVSGAGLKSKGTIQDRLTNSHIKLSLNPSFITNNL